jgi:hypothetical protein
MSSRTVRNGSVLGITGVIPASLIFIVLALNIITPVIPRIPVFFFLFIFHEVAMKIAAALGV